MTEEKRAKIKELAIEKHRSYKRYLHVRMMNSRCNNPLEEENIAVEYALLTAEYNEACYNLQKSQSAINK